MKLNFKMACNWFSCFTTVLCRYLLPSTGKSTKKKTQVVKKTVNPHYDHTFVYKDVCLEQLKGMCLELTVWDREAMSSNDFLGGVRLSSGAGVCLATYTQHMRWHIFPIITLCLRRVKRSLEIDFSTGILQIHSNHLIILNLM